MNALADTVEFDAKAVLARLGTTPRRLTSDSRLVDAGAAFAAFPGAHADGRAFIPDAMARGAGAVVWDTRGFQWDPAWHVPNAGVDRLQQRLGVIADTVYNHPTRSLWMIGVTGTNGKTSCSQWIAHALDQLGNPAGIVGTLGAGRVGALEPALNTTPDAALLHETLADFVAQGVKVVAMEVSSIGLEQGRINGARFDIALFTNLSRDHLDFHGSMAQYGAAKARLFTWPGLRVSVINADDPFGQSLLDAARKRGQRTLSYGLGAADIAASGVEMTSNGIALSVSTPWGRGETETRVVGAFNVLNLLGTLGVLLASDVSLEDALMALTRLAPPPGRMQRLGGGAQPLVVIDYAHSPDALQKVLTALRPAASGGELICVFGCGGDRDKGKRPEMGRIAATLADRVVITTDNPRSEDPAEIAHAVARGVRETAQRRWTIEVDRAAAIQSAIAAARAGDVVLLAGKGHETYQELEGRRVPFSDAEQATAALASWGGG